MKELIKNIYQNLLETNLLINSLINEFPDEDFDGFNEKLQAFIDLKGEFIEKLLSLKEASEENGTENDFKEIIATDLKEISDQIDKLEKENLELINEKKLFLSQEINKTNKAAKVMSAYKFNKNTEPAIIDESD